MPEEAPIIPTEPTKRRSGRASAEETGGGKLLPVILGVLVLALGFALYKRNGSASEQAEKDALSVSMLTSNVAELRTKLALAESDMGVAQSNFLAATTRRTAELVNTSNLLVQARQRWDDKQQEAAAAHAESGARAAAVATLEAQYDELKRQVATIPALQAEITALKEKLTQARFAQASISETLGRVRLDLAELERKLQDPLFLRLQERRVLEAAEIRQRAAAGQPINTSDPRVRLELQPDGSVRPVTR